MQQGFEEHCCLVLEGKSETSVICSLCFLRWVFSQFFFLSLQMQQMYDMIMKHKQAMQEMQLMWERTVKEHQHGYDSDEEVDNELGTWEHQLRRMEMDKTRGA